MKIESFETFVVGNPPPSMGGRYFIFVKLVTDDGIVGYGEVYTATFSPDVVARMTEDVCERHIVGNDPHHIERMWREVYGAGYTLRPDISLGSVLSGIECALWDIVGKAHGVPVYELLGGKVHDRLRAYTYLYPTPDEAVDVYQYDTTSVYLDPDVAAQRAAEEVENLGFTAVKFDPAGPYTVYDGYMPPLEAIERSAAFCAAIREAVGTKADLLFGTHGQFTAAGAIRLAQAIEPYDPLWFEEPVPPENVEEMARVARGTSIPVATGERLTTKWEFARVVEAGAAAILQPALGRCGGILEAKKIAAIAETHYVQMAPHLYCGPIEALANIQFATCTPNFLILEAIRDFSGFHNELLTTPIALDNGYIVPPTEPGIGSALNEEVARANPWTGDHLHLEPQQHPEVP
ncbi:MAG: mandelate racemase/muconate lactonizing enzyme family protein [Acidimicrobiales bacterium]|jgi:L-alanine-DL-glutamate epimerase-like enolase superfamily enzyme|nr:mandelate racemase/muconate lactonizing enzyme family protein [Acidimicrobiales bacterium]